MAISIKNAFVFLGLSTSIVLTGCGGGGASSSAAAPVATNTVAAKSVVAAPKAVTTDVVKTAASKPACSNTLTQAQMLAAINKARAVSQTCGTTVYPATAELEWDAFLAKVAAGHSDNMAENSFFGHADLDGKRVQDRVVEAGYLKGSVGENLGSGTGDIDKLVQAWLDSEAHCKNLMSDKFTKLGMSCASNSESTAGVYWTQVFSSDYVKK